MLQKGIYPYEYIGDWEKFSETSLPEQEHVYSLLNVEDITDTDYIHEKEFIKILRQKVLENIMICIFKATHYC